MTSQYALNSLDFREKLLINPIDASFRYLAQTKDYSYEIASNMLSGALIIGGMGCGKTTQVLSIVAHCVKLLHDEGYDENQLAVVHALECPLEPMVKKIPKDIDLPKIKKLFFMNDDAPASEGGMSRRSMSSANIRTARQYITIRHRLKELGFDGDFTVLHLSQLLHLLDKTLRTSTKVKIFKDYPDDLYDREECRLIVGDKGVLALKSVSRQMWAPMTAEEKLAGLESAVVRFLNFPAFRLRMGRNEPKKELYHAYKPEDLTAEMLECAEAERDALQKNFDEKQEDKGVAIAVASAIRKTRRAWKCWRCGREWILKGLSTPKKCYVCQAPQGAIAGEMPLGYEPKITNREILQNVGDSQPKIE